MKTITWLHFSDLHICNPKSGWEAAGILDALRDDLRLLETKHDLHPNLIFFTGDAAFGHLGTGDGKSIAEQFREAGDFIQRIRNSLSSPIPANNIFIVPGNHDVNDSKANKAFNLSLERHLQGDYPTDEKKLNELMHETNPLWHQFMERLSDYKQFLIDCGFTHLLQDSERLIYSEMRDINGIKIGISGLNSVWSSYKDIKKGALWLAGHYQIETLRQKLQLADIRLALMHYPFNWFNSEDPHIKREMQGHFNFLLHGHEHSNWVESFTDGFVQIAAGASYGNSEKETGYNIVRLNVDEGKGEVWLRTFKRDGGGGWIPNIIPNKTDDHGVWKISWKHSSFFNSAKDNESPESRGVFGRAEKINELTKELKNTKILTVYGMPGIGKSVLIQEVSRQNEKIYPGYATYRVNKNESLLQIYSQLAHVLGCRDTNPLDKFDFLRKFNYSLFSDYAKRAKPFLIYLDKAQNLFDKGLLANKDIKEFLLAITRYYPNSRIILESQETPPSNVFQYGLHKAIKISGIDKEGMAQYFKTPFIDHNNIGWELNNNEKKIVFERLGGKRAQGGAHPLAMTLLAMVASELNETPPQVLERPEHKAKYDMALEESLFNDLYSKVLNDTERHLLRLCALYKEDIPDFHVDTLNRHAGGDGFTKLIRLCLLTPNEKGAWYTLHSVIKDLTLKHIDNNEWFSDHEAIADAWLSQLKISSHPSAPNIRIANAAFYHLTEGECYLRYHELSEKLLNRNIIPSLYEVDKLSKSNNKIDDAISALELIIRLDENEHKAHRFLGERIVQLHGRGDAEALKHFRKAYELEPTYGRYLNGIGKCLLHRNEPEAFVAIIEGLDEQNYNKTMADDHSRSLFATCLQRIGRGAEASRLRRTKIEKGSLTSIFYGDEAKYLSDQGKHSAALEMLQKAEDIGCADDITLSIKASVFEKMGRENEASRLRREQIEKGVRNQSFYANEAKYLSEKGDNEGALIIIQKAESIGCIDPIIFSIKSRVLTAMRRENEASQLRCEHISKGSRHSGFYSAEAKYLSAQGDNVGALEIIRKAEAIDCADEYTFAIKTSVLSAMGREHEASRIRREQIDKGVRNAAFYNDEAKYLSEQGERESALSIVEKAERVGCADRYTLATKAKILEAMGKSSDAADIRRAQIEKGVKDAAFYNDEAKHLKDQGDNKAALEVIEKAEEIGCADEYSLAIKASLLATMARGEEAAAIRQRQIKKESRNPAFYADEAKYLSERGKRRLALEILQKAESIGCANEYILALKKSILASMD